VTLPRRHPVLLAAVLACVALVGCDGGDDDSIAAGPTDTAAAVTTVTTRSTTPSTTPSSARLASTTSRETSTSRPTTTAEEPTTTAAPTTTTAPLTSPVTGPGVNVYEHAGADDLSPAVADHLRRVYVPNSESNTVDVIDQDTMEIVDHFDVGARPQHCVPAWDLQTLYITDNDGHDLVPIDPRTGQPGAPIPVVDPYNMYFTPDGTSAIVVAEARRLLYFHDPVTWEEQGVYMVDRAGIDHLDFTADGTALLISAEFSGWVSKFDLGTREVTGEVFVGGNPIDVKLSPDGTVFFVANQGTGGVHVIDPDRMVEVGFIETGAGAHGLYQSRDATQLYVTNRLAGTVSVVDLATRAVVATWDIGGSVDMGGVSADGSVLWLTGRYHGMVYAIATDTGEVIKTFPVGGGPHGLCVWPQPGRYSIGHTGILR
jgi:YVTN family beta-propeller protein